MDQNAEIETESDVLKRIVALLFALAGLAERASARSYPVRCLVLWLLRHAEAVVRDWLVPDDPDDMQMAPSAYVVLNRNSPAEALFLAQRFRALAHMLRRELRQEEQLARGLLRGKAARATAGVHRRSLLNPDTLCRSASAMRFAMRCLRYLGLETAPRLTLTRLEFGKEKSYHLAHGYCRKDNCGSYSRAGRILAQCGGFRGICVDK